MPVRVAIAPLMWGYGITGTQLFTRPGPGT